ncbi:hypothetical protein PLICRDRAFT_33746 [Plicaturopsis crispa FD-325 SS-3]|nr:hypothetical protein PLICRDRAFT_33746 [Plicaturopsis crispa FD-325 SS-3]
MDKVGGPSAHEAFAQRHPLIQLPGYSLQDIWPRLSENQRLKVCECVAEILLKLYNEHSPMICTELRGTNVYTGPTLPGQVSPTNTQAPILLSPPFNQGPLSFLPPQPAIYRNDDYLSALAGRMHKVFRTDPRANRQGRKTGYPQARRLTDTDVERVLDTWARLGQLTAHHAGGFYVPGALSRNARQKSYEVLNSAAFGIVHTDMQMYRFIVRIDGSGGSPTDLQVSLATGWEHAFHGPLWSCARVPPWLLPRPQPNEPVHWEEQPRYREAIIGHLRARSPESWFIAHVYGTAERRFENLVSQHWIFRDTSEVALVRLKRFWEIQRPDIAFPLPVGLDYRAPGDGEDPLHQLLALDPPSTSSQWSPDG